MIKTKSYTMLPIADVKMKHLKDFKYYNTITWLRDGFKDLYPEEFAIVKTTWGRFNLGMKIVNSSDVPVDKEKTLKGCSTCPVFIQKKNWSCPPLFNSTFQKQLIKGGNPEKITVVWMRTYLPPRLVFYLNNSRFIKYLNSGVSNVEENYFDKWLHFVRKKTEYYTLGAGSCRVCKPACAAKYGLPCKNPKYRQPSLESVGVLVNELMENIIGYPMYWERRICKVELKYEIPLWYWFVGVIFSNELDKQFLFDVFVESSKCKEKGWICLKRF